jgi:ribosome biogenesis GTPase A
MRPQTDFAANDTGRKSTSGLASYERSRERLTALLQQLENLARGRQDDSAARILSDSIARLQTERFVVAVLGEFKRGKSTLLNALVGAEVLPVGVVPVTSVPCLVEYSEDESLAVEYLDGRMAHLQVDELDEMVSERGNPGNARSIRQVTLTSPAPMLRHGLVLVDTPGVGSIHRHSTEAAYAYLPHADAAVVLLGLDPPASERELDFLRDVSGEVEQVFLVLNKVDLLPPEHLVEAMEFVERAVLERLGVEDLQLYPLSAKQKDQGLRDFQQALERFLLEGRGGLILNAALTRAMRGLHQERVCLEVEQRALALGEEEANKRLGLLEVRLAALEGERRDQEALLHADVDRLIREDLDPAIDGLRQRGIAAATEAVELAAKASTNEELQAAIDLAITSIYSRGLRQLEETLGSRLAELAGRFAAESHRLRDNVIAMTESLFEVSVPAVVVEARLRAPSRFRFLLRDEPPGLEMALAFGRGIVPGPLGQRLRLRKALRRAGQMADRHAGRVRYDLLSRIRQEERELMGQVGEAIDAATHGIRGAVSAAGATRAAGASEQTLAHERVAQRWHELEDIEAALDRLDSIEAER